MEIFSSFLLLIGCAISFVGLVCVAKPMKRLKIPTRKRALIVILAGFFVVSVGGVIGEKQALLKQEEIAAKNAGYASVEEHKAALRAEEERKKKAEEERLAAEKKAEKERLAAEKRAKRDRRRKEAALLEPILGRWVMKKTRGPQKGTWGDCRLEGLLFTEYVSAAYFNGKPIGKSSPSYSVQGDVVRVRQFFTDTSTYRNNIYRLDGDQFMTFIDTDEASLKALVGAEYKKCPGQ